MEEKLQERIEQMGIELMVAQDTINELQSLLTQSLQERARCKIAQHRALEEIARLEKLIEEKDARISELDNQAMDLFDFIDGNNQV